jgi:hypothetical protein
MTSITTLLLQAAISLLLLVQGNPNVDPALREQAIAVANQAIKTATAQQSFVNPFLNPLPATHNTTTNPFIDAFQRSVTPSDCAKEPKDQQDTCWQRKAQEDKNVSYCENIKISNIFLSRSRCISTVAQAINNSSLCIKITDAGIKKDCEQNTR